MFSGLVAEPACPSCWIALLGLSLTARDAEEVTPEPEHGVLFTDNDGDGWGLDEGDCDDDDPSIYPGAEETPGDGIDSDCDGEDQAMLDRPTQTLRRHGTLLVCVPMVACGGRRRQPRVSGSAPPAEATSRADQARRFEGASGTVIKKPWTKSAESWNEKP